MINLTIVSIIILIGRCYLRYSVWSTPSSTSTTSSSTRSSSHLSPCSWATTVSHGCSISTTIALCVGISVSIASICIRIWVSSISTIASSKSSPSSTSTAIIILRCNFLDIYLVTVDGGGSFLHHLLGCLFSLKGNKAKVLWFIIFAFVNRPDHLCHRSKL